MEKIIQDIISSTGTTPEIIKKIKDLETTNPNWTKENTLKLSVRWGRKQLPQRLLNTACLIITNATYGDVTQFSAIQHLSKGASHHTMFTLLDHFSDLCLEAHWPMYGACVVNKEGIVPSGYIVWYSKRNVPISLDINNQDSTIKLLQEDCFSTVKTPSGHEIALKTAEYIHKHKL